MAISLKSGTVFTFPLNPQALGAWSWQRVWNKCPFCLPRQLCGSSITHSVHQSWCHKDWHIGKRQGLRLGCEAELRWPCRNESVASLAGSFPLSSHIYRSVTRQVSREACCKASVPARGTLILTQHSNVVFLGTDPLCLGARAINHLWGNTQIQANFSLPHPNPLWPTHRTYAGIPSPTSSLSLSSGNWHNWKRRISHKSTQCCLISLQTIDTVFLPSGLFREYRATSFKNVKKNKTLHLILSHHAH